jgi:hypothetical protein
MKCRRGWCWLCGWVGRGDLLGLFLCGVMIGGDLLELLLGRGLVRCGGVEKEDLAKAIPWLEWRSVKVCWGGMEW